MDQAVDVVIRTAGQNERVESLRRAVASVQNQHGVSARPIIVLAGSDPAAVVTSQPGVKMHHVGKHVVSRVLRTDGLYEGEYRDHLPDLLVEWASDRPVSKVRLGSKKIGELKGEYRFCRTGDHFPGGLFVAVGPAIKPGTSDRTVSIMDFAPTFAHLLDVDLPDVDGKPIHEILSAVRAFA